MSGAEVQPGRHLVNDANRSGVNPVERGKAAAGRARVTPPLKHDGLVTPTAPTGRARVSPRPVEASSFPVLPVSTSPGYAPDTQFPQTPPYWNSDPAPAEVGAPFAPRPAAEPVGSVDPGRMPRTLAAAAILLGVNLLLSVAAAIVGILVSDELIELSLGRTPLPSDSAAVDSLEITFLLRAWVNVIIALIYAFLIWQLRNGNHAAWRRLVWLSGAGLVSVAYLLFQPYPMFFHAGQVAQILVLFAMFALAVHPDSRAYCQKRDPLNPVA